MELAADRAARRTWNRVDANNIQASWKSISRDFLTLFSTIQTKSAETAIDASGMMLAEQGVYVTPHALANPNAFAGWAPSGLDIASYFQSPVFAALHAIRTGSSPLEALEYGRNLLVMLTSLAVMDTARQAESLDITSRPKVGYVRVESATCCDRCMILAGKWFRFNEGFLRHPHCHGRHVPCSQGMAKQQGWISDPMEGFKSLSREEQDKRFGANYAQAIRDGADIYQVVNSKRGMRKVGKGYTALTTSEGTTRYGWASMQYAQQSGRRMKRRLSIDGIYSLTGGDREKTIAALKANGYFVDNDWRGKVPEIRKKHVAARQHVPAGARRTIDRRREARSDREAPLRGRIGGPQPQRWPHAPHPRNRRPMRTRIPPMGRLRRTDFPAMIQRIERKNMDPANQNQQTGDNKSKKPENTGGEDWQSKFEGQRKVNRDLEKKLNEAYAKADKVDELEKQIAALQGKEAEYEAARKEQAVKDEALAAANQRILKAEVRAAASGKLTDPADALRYLDLSKFTVTADGGVDSQAIANSIGELLEQKPYLGKAEQAPSGANITPPSGTRDGDRHQGQLTRDDLKTMSPAEIVKAQQDGRLKDLLGAN